VAAPTHLPASDVPDSSAPPKQTIGEPAGGGDDGHPPPTHVVLVPDGHEHDTARSMQKRSFVKASDAQIPVGQSRSSTHGSQPLPAAWQLPNRCEHVGFPIESSDK